MKKKEEEKIKNYMCVKKKITIFTTFFTFWIKLTRLLGQRKNLSNDLYFIFIINLFVAYVLMTFFKKKKPFEDKIMK